LTFLGHPDKPVHYFNQNIVVMASILDPNGVVGNLAVRVRVVWKLDTILFIKQMDELFLKTSYLCIRTPYNYGNYLGYLLTMSTNSSGALGFWFIYQLPVIRLFYLGPLWNWTQLNGTCLVFFRYTARQTWYVCIMCKVVQLLKIFFYKMIKFHPMINNLYNSYINNLFLNRNI